MGNENLITIALIDDHEKLREALARFFESCNFSVVLQVGHGQMGLDYLQKCEVVPNVCILDINMPVTDGSQQLRNYQKNIRKLRFWFLAVGTMK